MLTSERKCRRFSHIRKQQRRDRTGWLGREDSNLGIAGVAHMLTATTTADSQAYDALAPDLVAAPRQNNRHLPRPVKRRLQILLVDQTNQFKIGGAHQLRLAIHGGT